MTDAALPPPIAGRYDVVALLGQGSFGRTYLARDLEADGREVALKQLRAEGEGGWKRYELFEREAAVLRSLRHQGIPEIFDHLRVPREGGEDVYLVMEYLRGDSLAQVIERREHLAPERLLDLLLGLLDILDYLHTRLPPVLHRDIKPANVILRASGGPALVDFGAVRNVFRAPDEGGSTVVGTYGYMPFEQYMGQAGPASDLYAVGATVLHLCTGRPPSDFVDPEGHLQVPGELPGGPLLRGVLARLCAHAPAARYPSARAVREAIMGSMLGAGGSSGAGAAPVDVSSIVALAPTGGGALAASGPIDDARLRLLAPGPMRSMFYWRRPNEPLHFGHFSGFLFLTLISLGLVPIILVVVSRTRRLRLARFVREGARADARVLRVEKSEGSVEVTYEFVADGAPRRGADTVFPGIARRWGVGDRIEVLYIAADDYDSVIISAQ
ncbi:MAG: serine/threonine-protein kinase [Nannocystaceae bacterium]